MTDRPLNLSFVQRDINTQLRLSRELLEVLERLRLIAGKVHEVDPESAVELGKEGTKLIGIANELVENASATGKDVSNLLLSFRP